nr:hypothetical protein [uncultured Methanospirillum sp.]
MVSYEREDQEVQAVPVMKKQYVYYIGFGIVVIAVIFAGLMVATTPRTTPALDKKPVVTISVHESPQMKKTNEGTLISYAVNTSRFADDGLDLVKAEVLDKKTDLVLLKLEGTSLTEQYTPVDPAAGTGVADYPVIRFDVTVPSDKIPSDVFSRLTFASKTKAALPFMVTGGDIHLIAAGA